MTYNRDELDPILRDRQAEAQKAEDAAIEAVRQANMREDLRRIVGEPWGRRFVQRLVQVSGGDAAACHRSENTHDTSYLLGRASIGTWVTNLLLNEQPEAWIQASREAAIATKEAREQYRNAQRDAGTR